MSARSTAEAWEVHAEEWAAWARTPGHDVHYERLNLPAFLELLPAPGSSTVDLGCGEGRLGRVLAQRGHSVIGVDSSSTLARLARAAGGYREVLLASASRVPLPDACCELVVAFMSLHDMDDLDRAVAEAARLLGDDGRMALAVPHPFAEMARERRGAPGYCTPYRYSDVIKRGEMRMAFESWRRPLSAYTRALEQAGLVIDALREPLPGADALAAVPELGRWREQPMFLHLRARRTPRGR